MERHDTIAVKEKTNAIKIWIVEDNSLFRRTIASLLNQSDRMICDRTFSTCEELFRQLKTGETPKALLLDIGLPGMSGLDAIPEIKSIAPAMDVIMLTVYDDDDKIFRSICTGASGYLLKSAPAERLIDSILDIAYGGAPINPRIARKILDMLSRTKVKRGEYNLSDREMEILRLMVEGLTKNAIAERLVVSYHTVNAHIKKIYTKLQVHSRSGAVAKVLREGLI
jgi:DNA-binding NarL/FixJ family response regulator